MGFNMKKYNYPTSKDYRQLYQHLMQHPDEAIVSFLKEKNDYIQLCHVKRRGIGEYVEAGSLGVCWLSTENIEDFVQRCEKYQLEYIQPTTMK